MKIYLGCDHAAYEEKEILKKHLVDTGHEVVDHGPYNAERCDYPDYASKVAKSVANEEASKGVLICGSGIGVSMVANRYKRIRAALIRNIEEAQLSRAHNDANILCLGARLTPVEDLKSIIDAWLEAKFEEGRHSGRIAKFNELGEEA
jgi:ribose 5-phosphate isomerase B